MATVHIIVPTTTKFDTLEKLEFLTGPDLVLTQSHLERGPSSIECKYDELLAGPDILINAIEAERSRADAIVVACVGDPALNQVREAVTIPVLGPGQAAMHYAAICGKKFSVICTLEPRRSTYIDHAKAYGLDSKLASVLALGVPVLEINSNTDVKKKLLERALSAIKNDDADVIILACAGFSYLSQEIESALAEEGYMVPVIDPLPLTVMTAATMVKANLTHSKKAYPFPPAKRICGYGALDRDDLN